MSTTTETERLIDSGKGFKHNFTDTKRVYEDGEVVTIRHWVGESAVAPCGLSTLSAAPPFLPIVERTSHEKVMYAVAEAARFDKRTLPFVEKCKRTWAVFNYVVLERPPHIDDPYQRTAWNWYRAQNEKKNVRERIASFWQEAKEIFCPPLPNWYSAYRKTA